MAGHLPSPFSFLFFFSLVFMDRDGVEVQKHAEKERGQNHLDRTSSVNKGFIIRNKDTIFLQDTAGNSELARLCHLTHSCSQSKRRMRFILPVHGASHITRDLAECCASAVKSSQRRPNNLR